MISRDVRAGRGHTRPHVWNMREGSFIMLCETFEPTGSPDTDFVFDVLEAGASC